jgi:protein farnesyltransferase/geranylgeranyltransferase type-1 subunit alpha
MSKNRMVSAPMPISSGGAEATAPPDPLVVFDWSDLELVPMPQRPEDPFFTVYSDEYIQYFGRFHAILDRREISARALSLCNALIIKYPKHVTAWWYKFHILGIVGYDFKSEMEMILTGLSDDKKSYQCWHYRQWLVDRNPEYDDLPFLEAMLDADERNFHAWSYAIWYARRADRAEAIYELALERIAAEPRNNSAWSARKAMGELLAVDPTAEFEAAFDSLRQFGRNECPFSFARAMVDKEPALQARLKPLAEELVGLDPENPFAWVLLLSQTTEQDEIGRICDNLLRIDPIRTPYYTLVKNGVLHCV